MFLNSSPSPFPTELNEGQSGHLHHFLSPNSQASSSSSLSCHVFFNSNTHDQNEYFHRETRPPHNQQEGGDNFGSQSYDHIENENGGSDLKFSIWKKEISNDQNQSETNHVKWMSSKMRLMLKMKKSDPMDVNMPNSSTTATTLVKLEDQKLPSSPVHVETDNSSNSSSNNPIRVCSHCNTTKTPLWRSGPRGPKSLCNACGIRQRKARRALAAAAAESGTILAIDQTTPLKPKIQSKEKKSNSATKYKKRQCKLSIATPLSPSPSPGKKNCFEDFLISLSKNLALHHVFPQDEKEAAILLMALSCGYVHG